MQHSRGRVGGVPAVPVLQRLPAGTTARQLPATGRLHRAAAGSAHPGEPDGAPDDGGRRSGRSAAHVTVVMPHYAYARSTRRMLRESASAPAGGRSDRHRGGQPVLTMALHAEQARILQHAGRPLTALPVLARHFRSRDLSNTVVVSPDPGNAKPNQFARMLGGEWLRAQRRQADDRGHRRHRRQGGRQGRDHPRRRDRHRRFRGDYRPSGGTG